MTQPALLFDAVERYLPMSLRDLSHLDAHDHGEDIAASAIHAVGAGLAVAALAILVVHASLMGDAWRVVSFSIYGTTLILLYASSTFYHGFRNARLKALFRIFDHAAIYLLIAGTYTPFLLVTLRGVWGWSLFGVAWGVALLGVIQTALALDRLKFVSLVAYLVMGWLIAVAFKPLLAALPLGGIVWLVAGGLCNTLGVVFYVGKRIPLNHAIWHVFVLAGSVCHFFAMLLYVLPLHARR
jgi:hemolysin III